VRFGAIALGEAGGYGKLRMETASKVHMSYLPMYDVDQPMLWMMTRLGARSRLGEKMKLRVWSVAVVAGNGECASRAYHPGT